MLPRSPLLHWLLSAGSLRCLRLRRCSKAAQTSPPPTSARSAAEDADSADDSMLDYDEYVEYLGDEADGHGLRQSGEAAAAAASAERRRRFFDDCPVDAGRRGRTGVIDPDELVRLLRHRNARDIVAVSPPNALPSPDRPPCIVVCTGRSSRHLIGLAEYALRVYKSRVQSEPAAAAGAAAPAMPPIEAGVAPSRCNWAAVNLGNLGLHCFLPEARARYDLEALWCLGPDLDPACRAAQAPAAASPLLDGVDWDEVARLAAEEKQQRREAAPE